MIRTPGGLAFAFAAACTALSAGAGCNMVKLTANTTADVLEVAMPALAQESDVQLAREAAPGQLKTVEGFWMASPGNPKLLKTLSQGYCEYAFGFLQDDAETLEMAGNTEAAAVVGARATGLFLRCMNYSLKLLGPSWEPALHGDAEAFLRKVKSAGRGDIHGLYFTAFGLASAINLNRDNLDMIAYLPKAKAMLERVVELDERFYNGGAHMALGLIKSGLADALGGDSAGARKHFERAIELTGGKFLLTKVFFAAQIGVATGDQKFFHDTLVEVLATSPAIWPEQRLANELAHLRARRFLAHEKELF